VVEVYQRFRGAYYRPDHEGSGHLRNVGKFLPHYTVQHPKRQSLHIRRRENLKSHEEKRPLGMPCRSYMGGYYKIYFKRNNS
jgi:hypothetical protein